MAEKPDNSQPIRIRISDEMRKCVEIMATQGLPARKAAKLAGIHPDTAVRNLHKAHVLALLQEKTSEVRDNSAHAAFLRNVELAQTAQSEHVRMEANKWIAGVGLISPVRRIAGQHVNTTVFEDYGYHLPDVDGD